MKKLTLMIFILLININLSYAEYTANSTLQANAGLDTTLYLSPSNHATFLDGSLSTPSYTNSGIIKYEWFEGNTYIGPGATRWYNLETDGLHTITLKVTDSDGNTSTDDVIVNVISGITANAGNDITLNVTPSNIAVFLDGSASVAGAFSQGIISYEWFDENQNFIGNGATRWYVITQDGQHNITLRITDTNGNVSEDTVMITVNNNLGNIVANAGADKILNVTPSHNAIFLDGSSSVSIGSHIVSYEWYDGNTYLGPNVTRWYVPTTNGTHDIKLIVEDALDHSSEDHMNLIVQGIAVPSAK